MYYLKWSVSYISHSGAMVDMHSIVKGPFVCSSVSHERTVRLDWESSCDQRICDDRWDESHDDRYD